MNYSLKIILDNGISNIRTTINDINNINIYCKNNDYSSIDKKYLEFTEKKYFINNDEKTLFDVDDYNFRASFQVENNFLQSNSKVNDIMGTWGTLKKVFRFIKRFTFSNSNFPFVIHLSIVKMSKYNDKEKNFINIRDSDVFNNFENYEIEIEALNDKINTIKKRLF